MGGGGIYSGVTSEIYLFFFLSLDCERILEVLEYTVPGRFGQHARAIALQNQLGRKCADSAV